MMSRIFIKSRTTYLILAFLLSYSSPLLAQGTIEVSVKYKGTPSAFSALKVTKDQNACSHHVPDETLIIGSEKGIKNVLVYLKDASGKAPLKDYVLDNNSCRFVPHAGFAHKGSNLIMKNSDNIMHNVHGYFVIGKLKRTILNNSLPKKGSKSSSTRALRNTGLVEVKCDAHEWMSAIIIVTDHPYHAVTGNLGSAMIKNVPAGKYDLVFYHEKLGEVIKKVSVQAGKTTGVTVEMAK